MPAFFRNRIFLVAVTLVVIGAGVLVVFFTDEEEPVAFDKRVPERLIIGSSVEGRAIEAYSFGGGEQLLLFVGGIHGGYEWNSVLLAHQFMDYLEANPDVIPENLTVAVIPNANPDGTFAVVGKEGRFEMADILARAENTGGLEETEAGLGRFNAHDVDLNRNFDCKWQAESTWRGSVVGAGTAPFSEPEAQALRDFVLEYQPEAVVFWHSQSNAVYASECEDGILHETLVIMEAYSDASGYPAVESFDFYDITGDAEGWLASIGIPALTVELSTHETIEFNRNLAGVQALFDYYGRQTELAQ